MPRWVLIGLLVIATPLFAITLVRAQDDGAALALDYPELRIVADEYSFEVQNEVTAGYTLVTLVNEGEMPHHAQIMRLNDDVTPDDFMEAMMTGDAAAVFASGAFVGGAAPANPFGGQTQAILNLEAGNHVLLCFMEDENGVPHIAYGQIAFFAVGEGDGETGEAPVSDGTMLMDDFSFELPETIAAGPQIWEVINEGVQPHEVIVLRMADGLTPDDVLGMFGEPAHDHDDASPAADGAADNTEAAPESDAPMDGPPPLSGVGGMQALQTDMTGWAVLDLEPGEYVAICFIPDPGSGLPHFVLGMIDFFTVE